MRRTLESPVFMAAVGMKGFGRLFVLFGLPNTEQGANMGVAPVLLSKIKPKQKEYLLNNLVYLCMDITTLRVPPFDIEISYSGKVYTMKVSQIRLDIEKEVFCVQLGNKKKFLRSNRPMCRIVSGRQALYTLEPVLNERAFVKDYLALQKVVDEIKRVLEFMGGSLKNS